VQFYYYFKSKLIIKVLLQTYHFNIHIDKEFTASKHVCVLQLKITNNILLNYIYYIIPLLKHLLITNGSTISWLNKTNISNFKISIPKDKSLIDNLQPLFNEIEELQKEIKELNETYNNQLKELRKEAIVNDNDNGNDNNNNDIISIDEDINNDEDIDEIKEEIQEEIKSTKSQTLEELKEQCKSLGIKGYSKKKKDELIELIKNHK
jgi:hypothetical protein